MSKHLKHPYVTYSGDHNLFTSLQSGLTSALPQESVEWRRSFGRPTRCVHVDVDFVPYSEDLLTYEPERSILGHPIFHTFWTDCPDVETYKANVRESLQTWLHQLKQHGRSDWMVILVETPDTKKTNKLLPRTTVLDKLKSDFGGKQTERCVSLIDPTKADSRSIESWQLLLSKMRHLIMVAYNRALNKFEEAMRSERERRTERNWSFCKYFLLQEELAQVFKMLSLYNESLVQYDELDALFTQFVLNSAAGDSPQWLTNFSRPCESWEGLSLTKSCDIKMQEKILSKSISLLEFRNYLFQCQASLLIQQNKPWELASRSLTFLQNTISELRILEATIMNGGIACWGFLSCLEVIQLLAKYKDPSTTDSHALHTAPLWAYARDKLKELGNLCGLMPGSKTSSEQLHIVISLVCGMGEDPHTDEHSQVNNTENVQMSPMSRIKEALSSQESFKKHFLDLSEVAISTYKHIGRIRSARLIGRDLALFYLKEGSLHQAANFLSDQLKTFVEEGWHLLSAHTQTELAKCYLETGDKERYIKTCVQLAACPVDSYKEIRVEMLNNMLEVSKNIEDEKTYSICTDRIFEIGWLKVATTDPIIMGSDVVVQLEIHSNLPVSITFDKLQMQLKQNEEKPKKAEKPSLLVHKGKSSDIERKSSSVSVASSHSSNRKHSTLSVRSSSEIGESAHQKHSKVSSPSKQERDEEECGPKNPYLKRLNMSFHLDYKQDKSLSSVSVNCLNPHKVLRREDSLGGLDNIEKGIVKEDFSFSLATELIEVKPGKNVIELKTQVTKKGFLVGGQIVLTKDKMEFICNKSSIRGKPLLVEVISENPQIFLGRKERELLAGIPQPLILTINSGSSHIVKDTKVNLKCSRGLTLKLDVEGSLDEEKQNERNTPPLGFERDIEISLPEIKPFSQSILQLQALTELIPQKDASTIEHNVCITSELLEEKRLDVDIHFIPPFVASHKIHTANLRKYIQIIVSGIVKQQMVLSNPLISFLDEQNKLPLTILNSNDEKLTVCADLTASYMWEMAVDYSVLDIPHLKMEFTLDYRPVLENEESVSPQEESESRSYKYNFELHNYKTLYTVKARVEPTKGSEFCRAGNMCHFHIIIQQVDTDCVDGLFKKKEPPSSESSGPNSFAANSIMYEVITDQAMWAVCGRTSGVLTLDTETRQTVMLDVMPLIGGFLPLPSVRLSKYIPAESKQMARDGKRSDIVGTASSVPRLEPFSPGQIYNFCKAIQVHVLPAANVQSESSAN